MNVCCAAKLGVAPDVVLSSTEIVSSSALEVIRSGFPSPLTSATVTSKGLVPTA